MKAGFSDHRRNNGHVSAFQIVPAVTPRHMLRHTSHLATALRPAHRRKKARTGQAAASLDPAEVAQMHTDAVTYPARERAAGGPQDRALYRCACGYAFLAPVEAGVHCPNCSAEQSW